MADRRGRMLFWSLLAIALVSGRPWCFAQQQPTEPPAPASQTQQPDSQPSTQPATQPGQGQAQPTPPYSQPAPTTPPAAGTQPPPGAAPYTIQRTSRLVILDLVVTDAKGKVLTDLKQNDFHVEEAGQPQSILHFDEAGTHTPSPDLTIHSTADLDRLAPNAPVNIILLDEFNTRFEDMAFARYSLKKYLERQPGKLTTPTILIAVDLQHFTVLHDYTQNKDELIDSLDHHFAVYPWQMHQGAWLGERFATAFITLRRVAEAVIGHPGHKSMIWIGRGFPSLNFANQPIDTTNRVDTAVQDCVNVLRDARITLYTIDPAGVMVNPGDYGAGAAFNDPFGGNYQFNRLAQATGGRTLYGRNDVDAEIGTAIQDGSSFYTLTYRPTTGSDEPRKFRRIVVTLDRPDLKVITREGYYLRGGPGRVNPQNPSRRLVGDLVSASTSTMVYDGVGVALEPSATAPDTYVVHVAAQGLNWSVATATDPRHLDLVLVVATFDKKGKLIKQDGKSLHVNATGDVAPTGRLERGLTIDYKLDHDPKAVRARFVVRATSSGRIGTADAMLGAQLAPSHLQPTGDSPATPKP